MNDINEIGITWNKRERSDCAEISSSLEVSTYMRKLMSLHPDSAYREVAIAVYLSQSNRVLGHHVVSKGGISGTVIDTRIVFAIALKTLACAVILCHNHPSGNLKPSQSDINLTKKCIEIGKMHDIQVLDHIILTDNGYTSLSDEGII